MTLESLIAKLQNIHDVVSDADVMFIPDGILDEAINVCSIQAILNEDGKNVVLLGAYPIEVGHD